MAYGLRYTLTQKLRNETDLIVKIYEDSYTGDIKTYEATKISLSPNSNEEEPSAGVITSQLNVSFIVSIEDDYNNFPDLLNANDRKYYVELVNVTDRSNIKWKGFLFNDYINIGYSTGTQVANLVCVDALSFLKYYYYSASEGNINQTTSLLDVINLILNTLGYRTTSEFYSCCSYFASGMNDRGISLDNEPFSQTYQFRRDFIGLDYYTILDNICKSFGCRLFQFNGDWWMMAINEMAGATNYYTKYTIGTSPTLTGSGTITTGVNIQPYSNGAIHFINNTQNKIIRKGYSRVRLTSNYKFANNYINNGTFKDFSGIHTAPTGFTSTLTGSASITVYDYPLDLYNDVKLQQSGSDISLFQMTGSLASPQYLPKMGDYTGTLSFKYNLYSTLGYTIQGICKLIIRVFVGSNTYYLNSNKEWVTSITTYITIPQSDPPTGVVTDRRPRQSYSIDIPFGSNTFNNADIATGYVSIAFAVDSNSSVFRFNDLRLTQSQSPFTGLQIERQLGDNIALLKEIDVPYGANYPELLVSNTVGSFFSSGLVRLQNWYRYGKSGTYSDLMGLLCRQYSNIFNKNLAALEGDLGESENGDDFVYLDKKYTVEDSSTNSLSYNGKIFMANRLTLEPYYNQTTSLQLLEITDSDNESVETIKYLG